MGGANLIEAATRKAGWEPLRGKGFGDWKAMGVEGGIGRTVLREQIRRLNGDPGAERLVLDWLDCLPQGPEGSFMAWRGLVEGVEGYRLVDWRDVTSNRFQVGIRVPVYARPDATDWRVVDLVWVPGLLWINGLPVVMIAIRNDRRSRGIHELWNWSRRFQAKSPRVMTITQAAVLLHGERIWVGAPWWLPKQSPGRKVMLARDPEAWLARLCQPGRVLAWLERGIRYSTALTEPRRPRKLLVRPESDGTLPRYVAVPGGASGVSTPNRQWTADERERREAKIGRRMEGWIRAKPEMTPAEAADLALYYLDMGRQLRPWLIRVARRAKMRLRWRQDQQERKAFALQERETGTGGDCPDEGLSPFSRRSQSPLSKP